MLRKVNIRADTEIILRNYDDEISECKKFLSFIVQNRKKSLAGRLKLTLH